MEKSKDERHGVTFAVFALSVLAFGAYVALRQRGLFGDGYFIRQRVEAGTLLFNHLIYHPIAVGLRAILSPVVALSAEELIKLISALSGGVAVALTCAAGAVVTGSRSAGLLCGAMLACLPGFLFHATATEYHAFHTAFATFLLLALVRLAARGDDAPRAGTLFLAAFLTPASHLSGIAAAAPALAAVRAAGAPRRRALLALASGFAVLVMVYVSLRAAPGLKIYNSSVSRIWVHIFGRPQDAPSRVLNGAAELLLYSVPASTLAPAGLWILLRRCRAFAVVLGLWVLSWWLVCFPIPEIGYGSYYIPTFPALAILSVVAARQLAKGRGLAIAMGIVAFSPGVAALAFGRPAGVTTWLAAAALGGFAVNRVPRVTEWRILAALPATLCIAAVPAWLSPRLDADPIRDTMRSLAEANLDPGPLVVMLEPEPLTYAQWETFLPMRIPGARVVSLLVAEVVPPELGLALARDRQKLIDDELAHGRSVWLVGGMAEDGALLARTRFAAPLLAALRERCQWSDLVGYEHRIWRLSPS